VVTFGTEIITTNTEQFLKTAELTKGILDYRILLAVVIPPENRNGS
jgi:hypothetical protein